MYKISIKVDKLEKIIHYLVMIQFSKNQIQDICLGKKLYKYKFILDNYTILYRKSNTILKR